MSASRYAERLSWADTRRAAAVLKAAYSAGGRRQQDVAAALGWSPGKLQTSVRATVRMLPEDALALAAALGVDPAELGLGQ